MKKLPVFLIVLFFCFLLSFEAKAQSRKSVSGAEVTGTFRDYFDGKRKGSYDEIKILALGKGKLKISFDLVYPYVDGTGAMSANTGEAAGTAEIVGDTAIFTPEDSEQCKITLKFLTGGRLKVTQAGADSDCGFGHNVTATGDYKKVSSSRPKFSAQ